MLISIENYQKSKSLPQSLAYLAAGTASMPRQRRCHNESWLRWSKILFATSRGVYNIDIFSYHSSPLL